MTLTVLIMAGGTGGHVFPALSVANALRDRAASVVWLGTRQGIEARLVPEAGIEIDWISVTGVRGKGVATKLLAPLRILRAVWQAAAVIRRRRPNVVLGMGGFASGPGGIAAWLLRKPLVIHEQNSVAGLTNRLLARLARRVLEAFPGSFGERRGVQLVGNPLRPEIVALPPRTPLAPNARPHLLVLGGSQGALALNRLLPGALRRLGAEQRPEIRHQTGTRTFEEARAAYAAEQIEADVVPFIDDMAEAYAWADIVVCRAGALTIAELMAAGLPSILVPFPFAVDDHQSHNAAYLRDAGAALVLQEKELDSERLANMLGGVLAEPATLAEMGRRARALARPDATEQVSETCLQLARRKRA